VIGRRGRVLVGLGVAVAGVALAIAGVEVGTAIAERSRTAAAAGGAAGPQSVPILRLDPSAIVAIDLSSPAGAVTLRRKAGAWSLAAPVEAAVKDDAVAGLLETFSALYSERVIEQRAADLAPYGLDEPSAIGRATLADGSTRELRLGDRTPAGTTWYLAAAGDPRVYAVWMNHGQRLSAGVNDVLAPRPLVTIDATYLAYLRLARAGDETIEVALTPELVKSDVELRASYLSIVKPWPRPVPLASFLVTEAFLDPLGAIELTALLDADPADAGRWGLAPARAEVELRDGTSTTRFQVGSVVGDLVAVRVHGERAVWGAPVELAALVARQQPFDWASRFAAIVPMKSIDRLVVASPRGTRTLRVTRVGTGDATSELYSIDGREASTDAFRGFYQQLVSLEADAVSAALPAGRAEVTMSYRLLAGGEFRVEFVPSGGEFYTVVKNGTPSGLLVNRSQVNAVLDALDALAAEPRPAATP
jgi:hypothetical protein